MARCPHRSERSAPGRHDQDFRFGGESKTAFFLVKLEDVAATRARATLTRTPPHGRLDGVKDFARGCMRTYLILKEKAQRWNADAEIQAIVQGLGGLGAGAPSVHRYSSASRDTLLGQTFDRAGIAAKGLGYERLDQLTTEVLLGVR
jgi:xylose isomerase